MNAQQLRNSILQEAIEGRLVPQDPNDEPASVLLERIREEKRRLVKEGKLKKKDLEETPISEDEKPFEIPKGWVWVRWGMLGEYKKGPFGSSLTKSMFVPKSEDAVKVYEQKNAIHKDYSLGEYYISRGKYEEMKGFTVHPGDIIVSCAGTIGETYLLPQEAPVGIINQALMRAKIHLDSIIPYWLLNFKYILVIENKLKGAGSAIKNIPPFEILKAMPVPLPPLAEQKRIVAKIEELLPKVEEYGKAQDALDKLNKELPEKLKKSILQEAIAGRLVPQDPNDEPASVLLAKIRKEKEQLVKEGKLKKKDLIETPITEEEIPFEIPESWEKVKLSFVTSLTEGEKKEGNYVCLDAKCLRGKSTGDILSKGKFVYKNDNIILVDGENSGEVFTVPCDGYMGSTFKQLWVSDAMCLKYVLYFIKTYKDKLRNSKKGAAIPHLNKDIFNNLVIGIPPLSEQHHIVEKLEQLLGETDKLKV